MINLNQFPKSKELTYTIIERWYINTLEIAFKLNNITGYTIRKCSQSNMSRMNDIKEHLPDWFDARYAVLISHFDPEYMKSHIDDISEDPDVKKIQEEEDKRTLKNSLTYY